MMTARQETEMTQIADMTDAQIAAELDSLWPIPHREDPAIRTRRLDLKNEQIRRAAAARDAEQAAKTEEQVAAEDAQYQENRSRLETEQAVAWREAQARAVYQPEPYAVRHEHEEE